MNTTTAAVLVPLLPLAAAAAILLTGRRAPGFVRPLAVLPTLAAAALAVFVAARQGGEEPIAAATRLAPTGNDQLPIELALHLDGFAVLVAVLVTVVASCVQVYSTGYLRNDARYPSYAALVSLFTAAMLLVVYTDDLVVLLVGWEVMGICSYFLVGHYWETPAARAASLKAFLVTKLGDVPFLIGILALASEAGTFRISGIVARLGSPLSPADLDHPTLIALLLLAGVAGKSAQVPLHTWLPGAMAGPTPVSALIHAATMVAAGVYFVARLLPVFAASAAALVVLAAVAALTMLGSALAALAQDDVKRVLAYSTIGQLGFMTGALAVADREAAVFHLITHGAFKALLFLAAGVLIATAGTGSLAAMSRMRGLKQRAPDAYWTMTVGLLALAAIPPFSGFFSKEAVLGAAEHAALDPAHGIPAAAGWTVLVAGLATALLTAAYAARLWLVAFHDPVGARTEPVPPHEPAGPAMTSVLWLLAVPALLLGVAYRVLPDWFDGGDLAPTLTTSVLATCAALIGGVVAYAGWRRAYESDGPIDPGPGLLGPLHRHAAAGFHLDAAYAAAFVRPTRAAARLVRFLDRAVVDTYVRGAAGTPGLLGTLTRRAQTGNVQTYLSALVAGALVLAVAAVLVAAGE
ncbi:NADH-quinone oxidoreductase subunit 5 family protein [Streptomyces johnsoniae]|uniref:NADH-quinone oxidoreductase subunit L n=1 Tax=Streptomyces johnsoniae TaxID=3075532 RepID=A0ABU2S336_9ACTN|nr:NADH-quinone oxidoreductase subunit L [Streptomyces sp. DSM 41886]MDT0443409.1 NADH-quinone oxidoreductase subunit L [Streptomyces sp. DSM 41886]